MRSHLSDSCLIFVTKYYCFFFFFFFQAEDGIRDLTVTGVQTCALLLTDCFIAGRGPVELAGGEVRLGEFRHSEYDRAAQGVVAVLVAGVESAQLDRHLAPAAPPVSGSAGIGPQEDG